MAHYIESALVAVVLARVDVVLALAAVALALVDVVLAIVAGKQGPFAAQAVDSAPVAVHYPSFAAAPVHLLAVR